MLQICRRVLRGGVLLALALSPATLFGAPGYTYVPVYVNGELPRQDLVVAHLAINNNGQVVFMTSEQTGFSDVTYRVYVATVGEPPQLVLETPNAYETNGVPIIAPNEGPVGINNDGLVSIPLRWPTIDSEGQLIATEGGYGVFQPGTGLISEIRGLRRSSGRLN